MSVVILQTLGLVFLFSTNAELEWLGRPGCYPVQGLVCPSYRVLLEAEVYFRASVDLQESKLMSQIASFTYLKASDVPFLGFWSKPKPRWFGRAENKFSEYLEPHTLREFIFSETDGVYVAFVFAWLELQDKNFARYANPVISSLLQNLGGAHWLVQFADRRLAAALDNPLPESQWPSLLREIEALPDVDFEWESFDISRSYVRDRILEVQDAEALLISVG
jgi:hypothetical protein